MSRYYSIEITDINGVPMNVGPFPGVLPQFTSFVNGATIPGALNIYLDLPVFNWHIPDGGAFVKIFGISISDISQASDLNGANIRIYGGMQKGLPLANPKQAGLLLEGTIQQAFGNWEGTQQSLDLIIIPGFGSPDAPKNIILNWATGQPLGAALIQTLDNAFPDYKTTVTIDDRLVLSIEPQQAPFATVGELAVYVNQMSRAIIGGGYLGVNIAAQNKTFKVYDGTSDTTASPMQTGATQANPKQIDFVDLIGQPTWFAPGQISFKCVMRYDLQLGTFIKMPQKIPQTILAPSVSQKRDKSAFSGTFLVTRIRHVGEFRQANASSWVTTYEAVVLKT